MKKPVKIILYLSIIMFALSFNSILFALDLKDLKGVELQDGTVIKGKVIESNVNQVIIEKMDGGRVSVKFDDISRFLKDEQAVDATDKKPARAPGVSTFALGMIYHYFDYKEDFDPPSKSTEHGWLPGLYLSYAYNKESTFYTKFYFTYAKADIVYDGATLSGTPQSFSDQSAELLKFEWHIGYPISITKEMKLIPYTGYGYQSWERGKTGFYGSPPALFVKELYKWQYIPIGVKADYNITPRWNIACSVAANFMFRGDMTAYVSEVSSGSPNWNFNLGNRIGFYGEIPITYKFQNDWALVTTPWYEYGAFGKSDLNEYGFYEPSSTTHKYGINLGISFSF